MVDFVTSDPGDHLPTPFIGNLRADVQPVVAPPSRPSAPNLGWAEQAGPLGGAFYDWRMIDDASLLLMVGAVARFGRR